MPSGVKQFVREHIPTMDHLEVLMRLHAKPDALFSIAELENATHVRGAALSRVLDSLASDGLARVVDREGVPAIQLGARSGDERRQVDALASMYHQRPVSLVRFVYEQPTTPLRSFSDAFRIRKDDE